MEGALCPEQSPGKQCIPKNESSKLLMTLEQQGVFFLIGRTLGTTRELRLCCGRLKRLVDDDEDVDITVDKSKMQAKHVPLTSHGTRMHHIMRKHRAANERFVALADPALAARIAAGEALIATILNSDPAPAARIAAGKALMGTFYK